MSLRDAIGESVYWTLEHRLSPAWMNGSTEGILGSVRAADAVLAMPEMEAIRTALRSLAAHRVQVVPEEAADWFAALNLPQSVIDWVLAKDTPQ